jgi:hypothetical protein
LKARLLPSLHRRQTYIGFVCERRGEKYQWISKGIIDLGVDVDTVKKVLASWGPGPYDVELDKDGKAFRPDGKHAGTRIPPAFGLAGVNLATWTGFGSVTYWNAYVAGTEMHGAATVGRDERNPGGGQVRP